jgi:hypothetical protein
MVSEREGLEPSKPTTREEMDRGVGSFLSTEKLDRTNDASCSYKMHQYLLGHGY